MASAIPTRKDTGIYSIATGLSMEWQRNGSVLVFTWKNIHRETIDAFVEVYRAIIAEWPVQEPLNQVNDLRFEGFSFTPYLRNTVQQVIRESSKLGIKGRVANVMLPGLFMRIVQFFLRAIAFDPGVRAEIFADFDKAMTWVTQ